MRYKVDIALVREGHLNIQGWAFGKDPESEVRYQVTDAEGKEVPGTSYETVRRDSVVEAFFTDYVKEHGEIKRELGYDINTPYEFGVGEVRILKITMDGKTHSVKFTDKYIESFNSHAHKKREKLLALLNWETVEVSMEYLKENGLRALWKKGWHKIKGIEEDYDYNEWYKKTCTTEEALGQQRKEAETMALRPKFSIVIPAFKTPEKFLRRMLKSIQDQTYGNFEVLVADATPYEGLHWQKTDGKLPKEVLEEFHQKDARFRYELLKENLGISENTNAAIRMAEGDYIVLADHDDELAPDALYWCAKAVNDNPDVKVIYTDEDKIDFESAFRFEPHFKTDYNPDLLRSVNYICHLFVMERDLLESISETDDHGQKVYERKEYDGAQDYDLILRACEAADRLTQKADGCEEKGKNGETVAAVYAEPTGPAEEALLKEARFTSSNICHIQKALYHWRSHQMSTAANPEAKLYAFEAGARAIYDHCKRVGLPIRKVEKGITYGFYHPIYETGDPLISVIIPNKDHSKDLDKAIRSLAGGNYKNLEFIVVENNSDQEETWKYYDAIQKEFPMPEVWSREAEGESAAAGEAAGKWRLEKPAVRVVKWEREFNYSAINNYGVGFAHGGYLLFLNNDIELIEPDSVREMLSYVQREDVGICGARLLYPDEVIQHAGVVVGFGGIAGSAFVGIHDKELTYMHRAKCIQDYSAVTAACLLSKRSVFDAVGGFSEDLAVAFNDIDYCMKVRALNKLVVYNPYAKFYHYESKSRGQEDTPEKVARFNSEIVTFAKHWPKILLHGDPYYNPALTFRKSNFVLKDLNKETVGEPFPMDILKDIVK